MQEKRHPKDILNAITLYTPRNQAAIFITLEYVNLGLEKVMPYSDFYPYEDDYYRMIEHICSKGSDEQLIRILELMMMDLRCLVAPFEKSITKTGKIRKNSKYSPHHLYTLRYNDGRTYSNHEEISHHVWMRHQSLARRPYYRKWYTLFSWNREAKWLYYCGDDEWNDEYI